MQINNFDVLIVYSHRIAKSANSSTNKLTPFPIGSRSESYNLVYSYFLKTCRNNNLKAAFTTSSDIIGAGKCSSFWLYEASNWIKVKKPGYSKLIFDKFSPITKIVKDNRTLLFSSLKVKPFNSPYLFDLFFDKQETYRKLKEFSIPTVPVRGNTDKNIRRSIKMLNKIIEKHSYKKDFSSEIVMKDRFGAGGRSVFKFRKDNLRDIVRVAKNTRKNFILQPSVKFERGFRYQGSFSPTDIRLIFLEGKIVQTYIRIAKHGDFRCNEHRGGALIYVSKKEIPEGITNLSKEIAGVLGKDNALFCLDFIISNNQNIYLLEGNTGPGLDWNTSSKVNEIEAKKLIRMIVKELVKRTTPETVSKRRYRKEIVVPVPPEYPFVPVESTFI
ncbi:hypothetical protein A3H19_02285 [Candidatus Woesebacteria bacterium RIFCSPLOWO2_12_FULL_39_9]|nr:MAG: hypothetical protein A3H19_02285 [Candidatus Woesebacteria bacterium RIFCSPLOWO2_12_FULL_39_9]